jgi:hypothetical protein
MRRLHDSSVQTLSIPNIFSPVTFLPRDNQKRKIYALTLSHAGCPSLHFCPHPLLQSDVLAEAKVLVFGTAEGGKSTIIKQMKRLYAV